MTPKLGGKCPFLYGNVGQARAGLAMKRLFIAANNTLLAIDLLARLPRAPR